MSISEETISEYLRGKINPVEKNVDFRQISVQDWIKVYYITHDIFFQLAFSIPELAIVFLQNVLSQETLDAVDLKGLQIQNGVLGETDFFRKSCADLIYTVPYKKDGKTLKVYVILEHKSYSDRMTIFQLMKYSAHVMGREFDQAEKDGTLTSEFTFSAIVPVVIHQGESPFNGPTELKDLIISVPGVNYGPNLKAILFDLNRINVDDLPYGSNIPEFVSVLKAMQAAFSKNGKVLATEALKILRPHSKNPQIRSLTRLLLVYMYHCSRFVSKEEYNVIAHDDKYVDQGEREMVSVAEELWLEGRTKGRMEGRMEGRTEGRMEGRMEGRTEGRMEGRMEGEIKMLKKNILQILTFRFKHVPSFIQDAINSRSDSIALESLMETALAVQSLKEFAKEL